MDEGEEEEEEEGRGEMKSGLDRWVDDGWVVSFIIS